MYDAIYKGFGYENIFVYDVRVVSADDNFARYILFHRRCHAPNRCNAVLAFGGGI